MSVESSFKQIISGQRHGVLPSVIRTGLTALSWPYSAVTSLRNQAYNRGLLKTHQVRVPVISVGNITTGGTGKTPVVAWVSDAIRHLNMFPGIISRGYRSDDSGANDEKRVLARLCPNVPHEQNADRILAAEKLLAEHAVDAIVMDDGFQHRRLARNLNVVLLDATNPFGYGFHLPRGLLRESLSSLRRADVVLITRSDQVTEEQLTQIKRTVQSIDCRLADCTFQVSFKPGGLVDPTGNEFAADEIHGKDVSLMTAIGNPDAFRGTCESLGAAVRSTHLFPDHHHYTSDDLQRVTDASADCECVLTTLKDLVKIPPDQTMFRAVRIETAFVHQKHEARFREMIRNTITTE